MPGMLQIITYLLCVYLIFKGFEILQIALMSARADRAGGIIIGILFVIIAFAASAYFAKAIDEQAHAISLHTRAEP